MDRTAHSAQIGSADRELLGAIAAVHVHYKPATSTHFTSTPKP
jgi:hypothetical protein